MIWLKRALPILVLVAAWFGYAFVRDTLRSRHASEDSRHALVTAQVWIASATLRANPQAFIAYRDSLLKANNMSTDQMFRYLRAYEKDPARQLSFSQQVSRNVDSLIKLQTPPHSPVSSGANANTIPSTDLNSGPNPSLSPKAESLTIPPGTSPPRPSVVPGAQPSDTARRVIR